MERIDSLLLLTSCSELACGSRGGEASTMEADLYLVSGLGGGLYKFLIVSLVVTLVNPSRCLDFHICLVYDGDVVLSL